MRTEKQLKEDCSKHFDGRLYNAKFWIREFSLWRDGPSKRTALSAISTFFGAYEMAELIDKNLVEGYVESYLELAAEYDKIQDTKT